MNNQFWVTIFERERLSMRRRGRDRLLTAVRLVRELARLKGLVRGDQLLADSLVLQRHWSVPVQYIHPCPPGPKIIREAFISIHPPDTPSMAHPLLLEWIDIMELIAIRLKIYSTSKGLKGIYQLLDPSYLKEHFPEPEEIMAFERFQVDEILQTQVNQGMLRTLEILTKENGQYALTPQEARQTMQLARSTAPELTKAEIEQEKALMILRIEEIIQHAKSQGDIRAELQALKLLTFVQGLHRVSGDDTMQELIKVISQTGRKFEKFHQSKMLETKPISIEECEEVDDEKDD